MILYFPALATSPRMEAVCVGVEATAVSRTSTKPAKGKKGLAPPPSSASTGTAAAAAAAADGSGGSSSDGGGGGGCADLSQVGRRPGRVSRAQSVGLWIGHVLAGLGGYCSTPYENIRNVLYILTFTQNILMFRDKSLLVGWRRTPTINTFFFWGGGYEQENTRSAKVARQSYM